MNSTPIIFLHGLLGAQSDWAGVFTHLQKIPEIHPLALDLPCHGERANRSCDSFAEARAYLHTEISARIGNQPFWLVGYSLGGRLALDFVLNQPLLNLRGVVLEGANIGLESEAERAARWQNDQAWAARFRSEPMTQVLADWYQQAVFSDLNFANRQRLIAERAQNNGAKIAAMLEATSLAKQPFYLEPLQRAQHIHFLIGERDQKFHAMVEKYGLAHQLISHAGHNAHRDNPAEFCQRLLQVLGA